MSIKNTLTRHVTLKRVGFTTLVLLALNVPANSQTTTAATNADLTDTTGLVDYSLSAASGTIGAAAFSANSITLTNNSGGTTTPGATSFSVNRLSTSDLTASSTWTIGTAATQFINAGSTNTLTLATASDPNGRMQINATIKDRAPGSSSSLITSGSSRILLAANNTYTGSTTISSVGNMQIGNNGTVGSAGTGNIINNGALTFRRSGADYTVANTISGTGTLGFNNTTIATILSGANTFTGRTSILGGSLSVGSLNSVTGGSASSNLGAPNSVINGTINIGNTTGTGTLKYTGTGETTDRVINLSGSTGGAVLDNSGTGLLKFTSNFTATGAGSKTLTLQGSTAGTAEIAGSIVNNAGVNTTSLLKQGTGTWMLSGSNTFTGTTTVSAGTLALGANNSLSSESAITVASGATLAMNSFTSSASALTLDGGGKLSFSLGTPENSAALLALTGAFTKGTTGAYTFNLSDGVVGSYKLLSFSSTTFTSSSDFTALLGEGYVGSFDLNLVAKTLSFNVSAIPEPSTFASLAGLVILGLACTRRRRY